MRSRDPAERSSLLDHACGEDAELRAEVEALLIHDERAEERGFLVATNDFSVGVGRVTDLSRPEPGSEPRGTQSQDELPSLFGRYQIIERIGQGGMGVVYLAHDTELDRRVALKVPHTGHDRLPGVIARFQREARAAATFEHANFCRIYDVGHIGGHYFIAMSYIEGRPLSSYIEPWLPVDPRRTVRWVVCLARALADAHRQGIIHRDLKPSNIMIDRLGEPIITDFGLALRLDRADPELKRTDLLMGTPDYMSPEQIEAAGESIGPASDIYSLGVVLYELLTGRRPFQGSRLRVLGLVLVQEPSPISELRPGIDPELESICLTAMAKKVGDRYPSMSAFADTLATWLTKHEPAPTTHPDDKNSAPGLGVSKPNLSHGSSFSPGQTSEPTSRDRRPISSWKWTVALSAAMVAVLALVIWNAITRSKESYNQKPQALSAADHTTETGLYRASPKTGDVENSIGIRMVRIKPGSFAMGSPADQGWSEESPGHTVQITRAFSIGDHEVTQPQYRSVVAGDSLALNDPQPLPVNYVSWFDAIEFCNALSIKEHRAPYYRVARQGDAVSVTIIRQGGTGYRLPTEAEWEYACRAGSETRFPVGDDPAVLGEYAWFNGNSQERVQLVGQQRPNAWGLCDMLGNVWEWCQDGYDIRYYEHSPSTDPAGPEVAKLRVIRGGSIFDDIFCRPAARQGHPPDSRWVHLGFRIAAFED